MITKELLLEIGRKSGLKNLEHIEKSYFQDLMLYNLYKKTNLLVFKGGTALYKLYNLPRFSEDLDFSILREFDAENLIREVIKNNGTSSVKEVKRLKNSLLIKIGFGGILTARNTIRIDINLKNPILEKVEIKNYIPPYIDINPFSMRVLNLKEAIAEKVHSLLSREKARDLYDLFFLLRFVEIDKKLISKKLSFFNMNFSYNQLKSKINSLKLVWEKELKPFVLSDLPDFKTTKIFVLKKLK